MAKVILVDADYIKKYTNINISVDEFSIKECTYTAQSKHIQPYLGRELYKHLIDLVASGDINLPANSDYKELLDDYIRMALAWWTFIELVPVLRVKISNAGILTRTPSETSPASQPDVDAMRDNARQNAQHFTWELIQQLKELKLPEYKCAETKVYSVAGFEVGGNGYSWNQ